MDPAYITEDQAQQCLKIVQDYVDRYAGAGWEPTLYPPGHEGEFWCASLEGAEEWAMNITNDESITWPDGVFAEPVTSWCLGLYPA